MTSTVLYDDGLIKLDEQSVTLRHYYLPWVSKVIPYDAIRSCQQEPMSATTGKLRIWGTGDFHHWMPLDGRRPSKETVIVLDLGKTVLPSFTPDDPDAVMDILDSRVHR